MHKSHEAIQGGEKHDIILRPDYIVEYFDGMYHCGLFSSAASI